MRPRRRGHACGGRDRARAGASPASLRERAGQHRLVPGAGDPMALGTGYTDAGKLLWARQAKAHDRRGCRGRPKDAGVGVRAAQARRHIRRQNDRIRKTIEEKQLVVLP